MKRPLSRSAAIRRGLETYYTGRPCPKGHDCERIVRNCVCAMCLDEARARYRNRDVNREKSRQYYNSRKRLHPEIFICGDAKKRAKLQGLEFDLTREFVRGLFPPDGKCPVLGSMLDFEGHGNSNTPTLDRLFPHKGYVKGNVAIISMRANRIKNDCCDPEVFRRIASWLESKHVP